MDGLTFKLLEPSDLIKTYGFTDDEERAELVCAVNLADSKTLAAFEEWKRVDGSKAGLLLILGRKPEVKQETSPHTVERAPSIPMRRYLSFGGGVNSVALYLLLMDQGMAPGDPEAGFEAVFVDHGGDWPETYEYVEMFRQKYPLTVLKPKVSGHDSIVAYCKDKKCVPTPIRRWCTDQFKVSVVHKYYQRPCWQYIGIDTDEAKRAKMSSTKGIESRWPLLEAEMSRADCVALIQRHGLPVPPKSGCWICPFQRAGQWRELRRTHPCLFRQAVDLERATMDKRRAMGKQPLSLAMSGKTLEVIVNEAQGVLLPEFELPPCQCGL